MAEQVKHLLMDIMLQEQKNKAVTFRGVLQTDDGIEA